MRDFTGFQIDTIQSAVFSWLKKKGQKWRRSYREATKLFGHTTVKCVRELYKSQGEKVSLPLVLGEF